MRVHNSLQQILATLLLTLLSCSIQAQAQGDTLRSKYSYGFFDDINGNPGILEEPSPELMNDLICAQNEFLTKFLRSTLEDNNFLFTAQDINWVFTPGEDKPLVVFFTPIITLLDGSEIPNADEIILGPLTQDQEAREYIQSYLWPLGGVWNLVEALALETSPSEPVEGRLKEAKCDPIVVPLGNNETLAPGQNMTTSATESNTTMAPSATAGNASTMTPTIVDAIGQVTVGPATTGNTSTMAPSTATGGSNATVAPFAGTGGSNVTIAPASVTSGTIAPNGTGAPNSNGTSATDTTDVNPTDESPNTPEFPATGLVFELMYTFATRPLFAPTKEEIESLQCQTDAFFQKRIREQAGSDTIKSFGAFIDWTFQGNEVNIRFLSNTTTENGDPAPTPFVDTALTLTDADIREYIDDYVKVVALPEDSLFLGTDGFAYKKFLYEGQPLQNQLIRATCPYALPATTPTNTENMVFFTLEYGFADVLDSYDPTEEEIVELICRTNLFFQDTLNNSTDAKRIQSEATYIDWSYTPRAQQPIKVTFAVNATYDKSGEVVPVNFVFNSMQVSSDQIKLYIEEYVWGVKSTENLFLDTVDASLTTQVNIDVPPGRIETADCPIIQATDPDPNAPVDNGTNPGGSNETMAPTMLGSAPNTDDMVFFTLEFGFDDGTETRDPTEEEIVGLICQTKLFFRNKLGNASNGESIISEAMYIDWSYTQGDELPVKVNFTANATFEESGEVVPQGSVFNAMQVSNEEIQLYIKEYVWGVDEDSIFKENNSVNFTTQVNIDVPQGRLQTTNCPRTAAPTSMPTVSPAPSVSKSSLSMPSLSSSPSSSLAPSAAPSVAQLPTDPLGTAAPNADIPVDPSVPIISSEPTVASMPSVSSAPTMAPTVSSAPSVSAALSGAVETQIIRTVFVVSNIDGLNTVQQIRSAGLGASWPVFVDELIMNMTKDGQQRRSLRYAGSSSRHLKVIGVEKGSAKIDKISNTSCGDGDVHKDANCNSVDASYTLVSQDEKAQELFTEYNDATNTAVNDGTYQNVLETVDPDTPLMIGVIPPGVSGKSGTAWMLVIDLEDDVDQAPTRDDIDRLICNVHAFVQEELDAFGEETETLMTNISWDHMRDYVGPNRFWLEFTLETTFVGNGDPVGGGEMSSALNTTETENDGLLENFVKNVPEDNVFSKSVMLTFREVEGEPTMPAALDMLQCLLAKVSFSPSVSPSPTIVTQEPTAAVTSTAPYLVRSTTQLPVQVMFRISNLDDITIPSKVKSEGLSASWSVYAQEIIANITAFAEPASIAKRGRRLSVDYVPNSAMITNVTQVACDAQKSHKGAVCHEAEAEYKFAIVQEILWVVNATYNDATMGGLYNGTYQDILNREAPGTPLVLGIITPNGNSIAPDGEGDRNTGNKEITNGGDTSGGMPAWAVVLVVLAVMCCCAGLIFLYLFLQDREDDLPSYQEEDFAYDFFIPKEIQVQTEVDDILSKAADVEEEDRGGSTTCSGGSKMESFEDEEDEVELEEDAWEDGDGGEDGLKEENQGMGDQEVSNNVALLTASPESGDGGEWEDEIGESEYAKEAHRLLLENGNDENISGQFLMGEVPSVNDSEGASEPPANNGTQPQDPPQETLLDPDGVAAQTEEGGDDDNVWDEDAAAAATEQPMFGEIVGSQDAWGDLQAAVESQESNEQQMLITGEGDPVVASKTTVDSGAGATDLGDSQELGATYHSGTVSEGGWDDVDDSTSSHLDDNENRWA